MKRPVVTLAALAALAVAGPAVAPVPGGTPVAPAVAQAKSCGSGYTAATIGGRSKCLRAGQYCAHGSDRQYRRYGFRCVSRDRRGSYHLTRG
ncbi:hypothetical protein ACVU7I_08710 [Patulibacter sp. S7RM1-6]